MDTMQLCPSCGRPLAPTAPKGLCPECLLKVGLQTETQANAGDPAQTKRSPFVPPRPEELAKHFPQLEILDLIGRGGMGAVYKPSHVSDLGDPAQTKRSPFVPPRPEELAKHFPQLEILDLIGRGGMGAVYKGRQPSLDRSEEHTSELQSLRHL